MGDDAEKLAKKRAKAEYKLEKKKLKAEEKEGAGKEGESESGDAGERANVGTNNVPPAGDPPAIVVNLPSEPWYKDPRWIGAIIGAISLTVAIYALLTR